MENAICLPLLQQQSASRKRIDLPKAAKSLNWTNSHRTRLLAIKAGKSTK